jgi:peptidoglycan/xylan/chitin deacetylase (PgdA/CDA1 family)
MRFVVPATIMAATVLATAADAASCPGNPHALGTGRVLVVNAQEYGRVGKMQYSQFPQLPLNDHEVVLTFDDGPLPPYTDAVLKTLASECVKATFFSVGRQANQFPDLLRRVYREGHTIGTHSQNHPLTFDQMPFEAAKREIDDGIASVTAALGDPRAVAPFFRIPGFLRVGSVEDYLASKSIAIWSADADADDWYKTATPESVVSKAMTRLNQRGRGILLLHDVQPVTALALPILLRELKNNGYRVTHVVPHGKRPNLQMPHVATAESEGQAWPRVLPEDAGEPYRNKRKRRTIYRERYEWRNRPAGFDGWYYVRP